MAAESSFSTGEPEFNGLGGAFPLLMMNNSLPSRDWRGRLRKARGDITGAIEIYRRLITPGNHHKWTAVLEPRHVLELARLLAASGEVKEARQEYRRFLDLWKDADSDIQELAQARSEYAEL